MGEALWHHGIIGMKWGVRRSPEELGHAPKGGSDKGGSGSGQGGIRAKLRERRAAKEANKTQNLSDEELRARINRLNMEETYKNLLARQKERNMNPVRKALGDVLTKFGDKMINRGLDALVDKIFNKDGRTDFDDFDDMDVGDMDFATNKKLAKYVENAKEIEKFRNRGKDKEDKPKDKDKDKDRGKDDKPKDKDKDGGSGNDTRDRPMTGTVSGTGTSSRRESDNDSGSRSSSDSDRYYETTFVNNNSSSSSSGSSSRSSSGSTLMLPAPQGTGTKPRRKKN